MFTGICYYSWKISNESNLSHMCLFYHTKKNQWQPNSDQPVRASNIYFSINDEFIY
jgi:hypothetical protein